MSNDRKAALIRVLSIGRQMSNLCFNLAQMQSSKCTVRPDVFVTASELRVEWDSALDRWNKVKGRLDP